MENLQLIKNAWVSLALIGAIVWLSYSIMRTLAALHAGRNFLYRLVLFPGVLVHEMSHLLACWVTNTHVVEVNFWSETGGHVVHHKPKLPLVQPFISFAPFFVGISLILLLSQTLQGDWWLIVIKIMLILMLSATLAPSKADFIVALEGIIFMVALIGGLAWVSPLVRDFIGSQLAQLAPSLLLVVSIMVVFWLVGNVLRASIRH